MMKMTMMTMNDDEDDDGNDAEDNAAAATDDDSHCVSVITLNGVFCAVKKTFV